MPSVGRQARGVNRSCTQGSVLCGGVVSISCSTLHTAGHERRQEPAHELLGRHQQVGVIEDPVPVGARGMDLWSHTGRR